MEQWYPVLLGKAQAGKVCVERQGLYYRFCCRCNLTGTGIYRLYVRCGGVSQSLGVVIPTEGGFGLETKVPVKRIGEKTMEFTLLLKPGETGGRFIPIYPEEPFAYISRLKDGFLARQNGQLGLQLPDESSFPSTG